ncbi:MAG: hypothetical protein B6D41_15535 [Chloroflexi bacterium UTCFX4]|nr:MAG: hypothetical protein B6D41_15535 [Chloroflexi bacterium UTCFX4]
MDLIGGIMERVSLRQAFHGEAGAAHDETTTGERGPDQVIIQIKRGKLELRVPNTMPDNEVLRKENMDDFMQLTLELEDGSELIVVMEATTDLVDTRLIPAPERARESQG